jgi:DNA helicase-2/ATP-dependent DNA helicase PcrA
MEYLKNLNNQQLEAVKTINGAILVFAGAGTGKTTTLVSRVFNLLEYGVPPENILLMTFTNKASNEMLQRIEESGYIDGKLPFVGTFHKFGNIFLAKNQHLLERRNRNFRIIDYAEVKSIIKEILDEDEKYKSAFTPDELIKLISKMKNSNIHSNEVNKMIMSINDKNIFIKLYQKYDSEMEKKNLIDLDDLQLLTYKILRDHKEIRERYSRHYKYIMIDEFQDTNRVQYEMLKLLLSTHSNIFVVGDDDQSIYGWRGAEVSNIVNFDKDFNDVKKIILNKNYRSTKNIIDIANTLISHNRFRVEKNIISVRGDGENIASFQFDDDIAEARFIGKEIEKLINNGENPEEIAILYRMNSLSFHVENALLEKDIKYSIKGKKSLYARVEIREILNILNAIANPYDDLVFLAVLKQTNGIGEQTINTLQRIAEEEMLTVYETVKSANLSFYFKTRAKYIQVLVEKLDDLIEIIKHNPKSLTAELDYRFDIKEKLQKLIEKNSHSKENVEKFKNKLGNVEDFYSLMERFFNTERGDIRAFLNLYAINGEEEEAESQVTLLTIHLSKGLEFKYVFLVGVNEGFLPSFASDNEEERRLAYVAFTRAKDKLYITYSKYRTIYGRKQEVKPSKYLYEAEILDSARIEQNRYIAPTSSVRVERGFQVGDLVQHSKFGYGEVKDITKEGKDVFLEIKFSETRKKLISTVIEKVTP